MKKKERRALTREHEGIKGNLLGLNLSVSTDEIQALRGGGISGEVVNAFGRASDGEAKNRATGEAGSREGFPVSIDGSRESRDCGTRAAVSPSGCSSEQ